MEQRQQQRMLQVLALAASLAAFDAHAALTDHGQTRAAHQQSLQLAADCGVDSGDAGGGGGDPGGCGTDGSGGDGGF